MPCSQLGLGGRIYCTSLSLGSHFVRIYLSSHELLKGFSLLARQGCMNCMGIAFDALLYLIASCAGSACIFLKAFILTSVIYINMYPYPYHLIYETSDLSADAN